MFYELLNRNNNANIFFSLSSELLMQFSNALEMNLAQIEPIETKQNVFLMLSHNVVSSDLIGMTPTNWRLATRLNGYENKKRYPSSMGSINIEEIFILSSNVTALP